MCIRDRLISCSRPGGPPANLQGIWNNELRAPWSSNYTININTEMNYWPAGVANLNEMQVPLNEWIGRLAKSGNKTAREYYNLDGWVAHHNSDIWALSNAVGDLGTCLLYTSDAADERSSVDLGGRRII